MYPLRTTAPRADRLSAPHFATALFLAVAAMGSASAATLSVGAGKTYATPCKAFAAAKDGDTIEVTAATYSGDVCTIKQNNLTIRGVNGRPKIDAAGKNAADKGTWVIDGNNTTVDNFEMYGSTVMDGNGAAFRVEGSGFTLRNSFIHDNQNGILSNSSATSDILIEYTEFGYNGAGDGQTHNLYIGHSKSLTFRYNFSHDANVGHNLKSRASTNLIAYNRFSSTPPGITGSTPSGQPSYEIDIPNGGTSYVIGNVIEQPYSNQNQNILAYAEEGLTNPASDLYIINNTFLNDASDGTFMFISGNSKTPAIVQNNIFAGIGTLTNNPSAIMKTNYRSVAPGFVDRANWDLHPTTSTLVINAGSAPSKSTAGVDLTPVALYKATASGEARVNVGQLDIGAYEATGAYASTADVTWTVCAKENGTCSFSGTREVKFGAGTSYSSKVVTGSTACTVAVFGDAAPNIVKTCSYSSALAPTPTASVPPATWIACANEGGVCSYSGNHQVRFGANGVYATRVATGPVNCNNTVFGDPLKDVYKGCAYYSDATTSAVTPPIAVSTATTWTTCAKENGTCSFSGTREVRYGANNTFSTKVFTGSAACNNTVFSDPIYGVAKSCYYSSVTK